MSCKTKRTVFIISALSIIFIGIAIIYFRYYGISTLNDNSLKDIDFNRAKKLMIVAHPDDDVLWGGGHLIEGNGEYLVVCLTNGRNKTRSEEFKKAITETGNQYLILNYPDKVLGRRSNLRIVKSKIEKDLNTLINKKNWDLVVTHNPKGEYGHIHHSMTSSMVTLTFNDSNIDSKLYYFGRYYTAKKIKTVTDKLSPMSDETIAKKEEVLMNYQSQDDTVKRFSHMNPYEEWTTK